MTPRFGHRIARRRTRGQVMVIFALAAVVVIGLAAIAIDGGYGLVQYRRAQNAADFAAIAGTTAVRPVCQGSGQISNTSVYAAIQDVVSQNSPDTGSNWTGYYLDRNGAQINSAGNPATVTNDSSAPPATACGVSVTVHPTWNSYLAQVIGFSRLGTVSSAKSVLNPGAGKSIGIVALDEVQPHEILGGGTGSFNVYGTIFANSNVPYDPWNDGGPPGCCNGKDYDDVVDAKNDSSLTLHGVMETVSSKWPLDWCYGKYSGGNMYNNSGTPPPDPFNTAKCQESSSGAAVSNLKYDRILNGQTQINDPLLPDAQGRNGLLDPFVKSPAALAGWTQGLCPGETVPTPRGVPAASGGVITLQPGDYANPVVIDATGIEVDFADCSGTLDTQSGTSNYPGVFRFEGGLFIYGGTVKGGNVMIAAKSAVPIPGNVPGAWNSSHIFVATGIGNGAPCFPAGVVNASGQNQTDGTHGCGGTNPSDPNRAIGTWTSKLYAKGPMYGVLSYAQQWSGSCNCFPQDTSAYGTGTNFSVILSGSNTATFNLTAPQTGPYRDVAVFQARGTAANFGMDAEPSDQAAITINGVVYNGSLPCMGFPIVSSACTNAATMPSSNPFDYWDIGITFHSGGTMQAGLGTTGSTSSNGYPNQSSGSVTVNGPCVVGDFNTDGSTIIAIDGTKNAYNLPGIIGSGNPPVTG